MARGSRLRNEVDGDASEEDGPAGSGDQANDYAESSGLDSGSGDDYVDEDEEEEGGEEGDAEEPPEDDEIFNRLAGVVAHRTGKEAMEGISLEDQLALAEDDDLDIGGPSRAKRKLRPKTKRQRKPSHEVQRLLGQANMAYAQGELEKTIELFLEVIRHDPYVIAAWNTLATVYEEMDNEEGARQMRFFAAHIDDDAATWRELASDFRQRGQSAQCMYCLRKAMRREPDDLATLFELASLYRLGGQDRKAAEAFRKIIQLHGPATHDFSFLNQFHPLLISLHATAIAASAYRTAFEYHLAHISDPSDPGSSMQLEHVVTLVDDLMQMDELEEALGVVRRGQRWLQSRKEQTQWDSFEDDREFDPPGTRRGEEGEGEGEDAEERFEGFQMDVGLRHRLALLRLRLGDDDEALIHIDEILTLDVIQYQQLFTELGEALIKREMYEKALDCFAVIQECEAIDDHPTHIFSTAICQHKLKDYNSAIEALEWVISVDENNLEARLRYAQVLEDVGRKAEALEVITEVLRLRATRERDRPKGRAAGEKSMSKSEKAGQRKLTKRIMEDQMRSTMESLWQEVQAAEAGIQENEAGALDRYIQAAGTMIENFRLAKGNFGKSRGVSRVLKQRKHGRKQDLTSEALALQDRLERAMGFEDEPAATEGKDRYLVVRQTHFYGLDCEEWLSLVVKYCCVLMVKNEEDVAHDILEHVLWSGLFNNRRSELALRLTIITCAMRTRSYDKVVDNCRRIAQLHQFRQEPFLLILGALGGGGIKASNAWQSLQLQKFLHRDLRIHDDVVRGRKVTFSAPTGRWSTVIKIGLSRRLGDEIEENGTEREATNNDEDDEADGDEEDEGRDILAEADIVRPTVFSPKLNVLYGQIMLSTKAYQSALFYLFRAYEIIQDDPFLNLLIAQAYFGRMGNRQADNKNYQVAQALAFLARYRKCSKKDAITQEEVEYNFGRSFHGIGVIHLAVEHYEKVLTSIQRRMEASEDPEYIRDASHAQETAHNLMLIYAASGSVEMAREKSKWLAI